MNTGAGLTRVCTVEGLQNAWRLYDWFPLLPADDRRLDVRFPSHRHRNHGFEFLGFDTSGKALLSATNLLDRVKARIAADKRLPPGTDREAVQRGETLYGGWFTYIPLSINNIHPPDPEFPVLLVPPEERYRDLLKYLGPEYEGRHHFNMRLHAIRVMANYHDPEVVAALKKHLHNTAVFEVRYRLPDRQRIAIGRYVWGEESPFEEPTGDVEIKRTFFMRLAAYESLRKMGIEVKRPRLSPD